MQRNVGVNQSISIEISKIVAGSAIVFNNENNRKTGKNGFIYKLKGFFSFSRSDVINVRADVWRGRAASGKSPHRFWMKVVLDEWEAIPLDL